MLNISILTSTAQLFVHNARKFGYSKNISSAQTLCTTKLLVANCTNMERHFRIPINLCLKLFPPYNLLEKFQLIT